MNRIILSGFLLFGILINSFSQDTNYIYYNKKWDECKISKAKFIKKEIALGENYILEYWNTDGSLIYQAECSSINPLVENGTTLYYREDGKLIEKGFFNNGYPDSLWYVFNPRTEKFDTLNYIGIKDLITPIEGPFSFEPTFVIVEEMPSFPNKNDIVNYRKYEDFTAYRKSARYYPMYPRMLEIQGWISLRFTVGPDGKIYDIGLVKEKGKFFTYEAIRVLRDSPKWNPGLQKNEPVPVRASVFVSFYLD